jgi:hypothetical protein
MILGRRKSAIGNRPVRRVDHHHGKVIDTNEARGRAVEKMRQILTGTQALELTRQPLVKQYQCTPLRVGTRPWTWH